MDLRARALAVMLLGLCRPAASQTPRPPAQPLPYSHKTHLALGLKCQDCHPNPDPGEHMTFPATARCMACHNTIAKDKSGIQKLAEFARSGSPVPWARLYVVPNDVFWSHRSHLKAGLKCDVCHGDVSSLEVMTRVTNVTTMEGCVDCHRLHNANTGCEFCHDR